MSFWNKKFSPLDYSDLIGRLERGNLAEIKVVLWQDDHQQVEYLPVTYGMLFKMKKPAGTEKGLSVYKSFTSGKFELLIFNIDWATDLPYSPLIIDRSTQRIAGIMLLFNELSRFFSDRDKTLINELGLIWTTFAIEKRFGIKI